MYETPAAYAERARQAIAGAVSMDPDYSTDSLAFADHYLRQVPRGRPELLQLVAATVGSYFGEILRRALGASWNGVLSGEPERFRLCFEVVPITCSPVGMAAEAVTHRSVRGYDGTLHAPQGLRPLLESALAAMSPVSEETYYSLTGRFETLAHLIEILAAQTHSATR